MNTYGGSPPHTCACQRASEVGMTQVGLYILPQPKGVYARKVAAIALHNKDFRRACECMNEQAEMTKV